MIPDGRAHAVLPADLFSLAFPGSPSAPLRSVYPNQLSGLGRDHHAGALWPWRATRRPVFRADNAGVLLGQLVQRATPATHLLVLVVQGRKRFGEALPFWQLSQHVPDHSQP